MHTLTHSHACACRSAGALSLRESAAAADRSASSMFSAVRHLGMTKPAGAWSDHTAGRRDESPDTLCDVAVRLLVLVLCEADALETAFADGFDPARQLEELVQHAACWCQKAAHGGGDADGGGRDEPVNAVSSQQLGTAVARLVQARPPRWPPR